jgi:SAM-dependent methyltransferase
MLKSTPLVPSADSNLPIALRPGVDFGPLPGSVFDDPGDEKSWHVSQLSTSLTRYFEGREPSWYASAVAPLAGAERVLDLGCGPGLALRALLEQGSSTVLGIERWPAFVAKSTPQAPIVAHDLSLPMPFLGPGSFDGVFSHYVLDYVSPICARQVLREAHRVLSPGGLLVIYLAGMGLGGGDESRTVSYSPPVMRRLLAEAGFDDATVEASPNGRNTVVRARRPESVSNDRPPNAAPGARIEGDTQLSASWTDVSGPLEFELAGTGHRATFNLERPGADSDDSAVGVCVRVQLRPGGGTEAQLCVWCGYSPVAAESVAVEFTATEVRVRGGVEIRHAETWTPSPVSLEPACSAYSHFEDLPSGRDLSESERGAEGRRVVVEPVAGRSVESWDMLAPGRNRFLVRRAFRTELGELDRDWLAGRLHGVVVGAAELVGEERRDLLLWSSWRQCLLFLEGENWGSILRAAERRVEEIHGPLIIVDPAPSSSSRSLPPDVASFVARRETAFVLLDGVSLECSRQDELALISSSLLTSSQDGHALSRSESADETLRYLTERTLLMRLRQNSDCSWGEVGRRPPAS